MLGLEKGFVTLLPHSEQWHALFAEQKAVFQNAIGEFVIDIQHIGSTSVCGIAAKPILDIAVAIRDKASGERCIAPIENLGYTYRGENGIAGRFYFVKGAPARTHHLHMLLANSRELRNHLFFRDFLRANPESAAQYDKLKKELASKHENDRDAYTDGKTEFVEQILRMARR